MIPHNQATNEFINALMDGVKYKKFMDAVMNTIYAETDQDIDKYPDIDRGEVDFDAVVQAIINLVVE